MAVILRIESMFAGEHVVSIIWFQEVICDIESFIKVIYAVLWSDNMIFLLV